MRRRPRTGGGRGRCVPDAPTRGRRNGGEGCIEVIETVLEGTTVAAGPHRGGGCAQFWVAGCWVAAVATQKGEEPWCGGWPAVVPPFPFCCFGFSFWLDSISDFDVFCSCKVRVMNVGRYRG